MNEAVIYWIFENLDVQNYKFNEIPFVYEVAPNVKRLFYNHKDFALLLE